MKFVLVAIRDMYDGSPSPRRAWIEIRPRRTFDSRLEQSPSPRRAWIEIVFKHRQLYRVRRRPPHGGRGLKSCRCQRRFGVAGRPPHGGRGLKLLVGIAVRRSGESPSPRRAWIEIGISGETEPLKQRRPPHGGRGLKSDRVSPCELFARVALPTEGVD